MCHHYRLLTKSSELSDAVSAQISQSQMPLPFGDFYPLSQVPVIRLNSEGHREIVAMQWGLLPFWWKPSRGRKSRKAFQRKCFNARSETVHEKPTFREAFEHRDSPGFPQHLLPL
jgi:putative SOS response-associated peptidase YedK